MKIEPLEFNCLQVSIDHLIEGLEDLAQFGSEPLHQDDADALKSAYSVKAKLDQLHKAIESEGGFGVDSIEMLINEEQIIGDTSEYRKGHADGIQEITDHFNNFGQ